MQTEQEISPHTSPLYQPYTDQERKLEWEKSQRTIEHEKIIAMTKTVEQTLATAANDFHMQSEILDPAYDEHAPLITADGKFHPF